MFDDEKIKIIRKMPEGDSIIVIWVQLLCLAGKVNDSGSIYMGQNLYYTDEMLATVLDQPVNTVRLALDTLEKLQMIEISKDGEIEITNWSKHQNIQGMERVKDGNAERQRVHYYRNKLKELGVDITSQSIPDDSDGP